jgi:hypothetical protein
LDEPTTAPVSTLETDQENLQPQDSAVAGDGTCDCGGTCDGGNAWGGFVYAIGRVRVDFPSQAVKEEFDQQIGRMYPQPTPGTPDDQLFYEVLRQGENLYLAREMCWILRIDGVDAYILRPRTYVELYDLVSSLEPVDGQQKFDVIVGPRGPLAGPDVCNGLQLPIVVVNQDYHFAFDEFVTAMVERTQVPQDVVQSMFRSLLQLADNAGETDEHRALNYLTLRYPGVYIMANELLATTTPHSLTRVNARPSNVQGTRRVVDVVFEFTQRVTGELVYRSCRVDVTGQFPFLVTRLAPYFPQR